MVTREAIVERARQLVWVVVRCDVENLTFQRRRAVAALAALEARAAELGIGDLYDRIATLAG